MGTGTSCATIRTSSKPFWLSNSLGSCNSSAAHGSTRVAGPLGAAWLVEFDNPIPIIATMATPAAPATAGNLSLVNAVMGAF